MPEWITPLLRVLVAIPSFGNCSTRNTSCHCCETSRAIAQPMTPPPIIKTFAWSINKRIKQKPQPMKASAKEFRFQDGRRHLPAPALPANIIKQRRAILEPRLGPIMHGVRRAMASIIRMAPKRSSAVHAILVQGIEENVERCELLLVVPVIVRDAIQRLQARILRRHPLAHHFYDRVAAGDLNVLLALASRTRRSHLVVHAASRANNRRIPHAPWNFPRQPRSRRSRRDVPFFIDRHTRNSARRRMRNHPLRVSDLLLVTVKNGRHVLLPLR